MFICVCNIMFCTTKSVWEKFTSYSVAPLSFSAYVLPTWSTYDARKPGSRGTASETSMLVTARLDCHLWSDLRRITLSDRNWRRGERSWALFPPHLTTFSCWNLTPYPWKYAQLWSHVRAFVSPPDVLLVKCLCSLRSWTLMLRAGSPIYEIRQHGLAHIKR